MPIPTQPAPDFSGTAVVDKEFKQACYALLLDSALLFFISPLALSLNLDLHQIGLEDYKGKYLVLFFYPLDWTFVCPTEIYTFSDRVGDFKACNCEVVACSVDSEHSHLAWINTPRKKGGLGDMNIPMLADVTKQIAADYGCLLPGGVALRATFIIDGNGILRHVGLHDLPVGRNVDEVLRLVQVSERRLCAKPS
jgi:alkyl hydroperoxide reductase subunit AhpC